MLKRLGKNYRVISLLILFCMAVQLIMGGMQPNFNVHAEGDNIPAKQNVTEEPEDFKELAQKFSAGTEVVTRAAAVVPAIDFTAFVTQAKVLKNNNVIFDTAGSMPTEPIEIINKDKLKIIYTFNVDADQVAALEMNQPYNFSLPTELKVPEDKESPLMLDETKKIGVYGIRKNGGGYVTFHFDNGAGADAITFIENGFVEVEAVFERSGDNTEGETGGISFVVGGAAYTLNYKTPPDEIIPKIIVKKTGEYKQNEKAIHWNVAISVNMEPEPTTPLNYPIKKAKLRDKLPSGYSVSNLVQGEQVLFYEGDNLDTADWSVDVSNDLTWNQNEFTVDLVAAMETQGQDGLLHGKNYGLAFVTAVDDGDLLQSTTPTGTIKIKNEAQVEFRVTPSEGDLRKSNISTAEVPIEVKLLKKDSAAAGNKKIKWTVTVNESGCTIADAALKDTFNVNDLELSADAISYSTQSGVSGNLTAVANVGDLTGTYQYHYDSTTGVLIIKLGNITEKHTIVYHTNILDSNGTNAPGGYDYKNKVKLTGTGSKPSVEVVGSFGKNYLTKKAGEYLAASHEFVWTIGVDISNDIDTNFGDTIVITDVIPNGLKLSAGNGPLEDAVIVSGYNQEDPQATMSKSIITDANGNETVEVTFNGAAVKDKNPSITIRTVVADSKIWANNDTTTQYSNTANLKAGNIELSAAAVGKIKSNIFKKQSKNCDYLTRRVTWELTVNANKDTLNNLIIKDVIDVSDPHTFVADSVKVISPGGKIVKAQRVENNGKSLYIELADKIEETWTVTYETMIDEEFFKKEYDNNADRKIKNSASLTTNERPAPNEITVSAEKEILSSLVSKGGKFNTETNCIDWEVVINKNKLTLNNLQLEDQLSDGLTLDTTSFMLYKLDLKKDGSVDTDVTAKAPEILTAANVEYDAASNKFLFLLHKTITDPYLLKFSTIVRKSANNENFSNTISFRGTQGEVENTEGNSGNMNVGNNMNAGASSSSGKLILKKTDKKSGKALSGAKFTLYNSLGVKVKTAVTDKKGEITWENLNLYRNYTLREEEPPYGYLVMPDINVYLKKVGTSTELILKNEIANSRLEDADEEGTIKVVKMDAEKKTELAGAVFEIRDSSDRPVGTAKETDVNGEAEFSGLKYQETYFLHEISPPKGYKRGTKIQEFIFNKQNMVLIYENEPWEGSITITKKASDTQEVLNGAKFELLDADQKVLWVAKEVDLTGKVTFDQLEPGKVYYIRETNAPEGYLLKEEPQMIHMTTNKMEVDFINEPLPGKLKVVKKDKNTLVVLQGAAFRILDENGTVAAVQKETDENGICVFEKLKMNKKYYLEETRAPEKYDLNTEKKEFILTPDFMELTIDFLNQPTRIVIIPVQPGGGGGDKTPSPDITPSPGKTPEPGITPKPSPAPKPSITPTPGSFNEITDNETPTGGVVDLPEGSVPNVKVPPKHGTATVDPNGKWEYVPDKEYVGKDRFTIVIEHPDGELEDVLIEVEVTEIPLGPAEGKADKGKNKKPSEELPKTGVPAKEVFYLAGGALALLGLFIRKKR